MRNKQNHLNASARRLRIGLAVAASALAVCVLPATALGSVLDTTQFSVTAGSLNFGTAPDTPNLNAVTLNGQAQTTNSQMANFSVADATGSGSGYNVTVAGDGPSGSAVFKQFCTVANCGADPAGYVSGGKTLAVNSLTLNSTSAIFTAQNGSTGSAPTHSCNSGCFVDTAPASPTKIVSAASGAGMGTFQATNFSTTSVALAAPSTIRALPANEIYHVDLVWSLNTGP